MTSKDIKPVLNALANLALELESFVTALVAFSNEAPELLVSEPQVVALLDRQKQEAILPISEHDQVDIASKDDIPAITIEQVRRVLAEKSQNGKQPQVKELIHSL